MASISLPADITDPILLADWLELLAINSADGNSSHGDLQRVLNRLGADDVNGMCTNVMGELNRRVVATGASYPFTFSGTLLRSKDDWHSFTPYVFCLLLSYCDDREKRIPGSKHEIMFEQLACLAAKRYLGGEAIRFGAPRDSLPKSFRDALVYVCESVNEWSCSVTGRTLSAKDGGLDLVAWKHFPDRQVGKLILFGHCASGTNWEDKINELQPNDFCSRWLGGDKSPIVKSFFIPHRLPSDVFCDRAISAKLFFDRCRIVSCVSNEDFCSVTHNANTIWCERVFKKITS